MSGKRHGPCSADEGDYQQAILGLRGIFWALHLLVVHGIARDVVQQEDIDQGIDELIVAGQMLADEISGRF